MRLCIVPNFLSPEGCEALSAIADTGVKEGWVGPGIHKGGVFVTDRLTSRLYNQGVKLPQEVLDVEQRIIDCCRLRGYQAIAGHGSKGVVVSITYPGGNVYEHRDPLSSTGVPTLRCNILTRAPEVGGKLYLEGECIAINPGDLHCYLASEHYHYVSEVQGGTSRVLWMFGAHVPAEDWNSKRIGPPDAV